MTQQARPGPGQRMGPRPLPLHLSMAMTLFGSSPAALTNLTNASADWNKNWLHPSLHDKAEALAADIRAATAQADDASALPDAVAAETRHRIGLFLKGVEDYRRHPYRRTLTDPPAAWDTGESRLLDYGATGKGPPVLLVPSLINRAYVLDLAEDSSFARWLAGAGLHPYLMDWGYPGPAEAGFGIADYAARLGDALTVLNERHGRPVHMVGYCMGGLLTLAATMHHPARVARQVLLATPWDFHGDDGRQATILKTMLPMVEPVMDRFGLLPTDVLQMFFALLDPTMGVRKFSRFAGMDPDGAAAQAFVALEDWLNDGVPLSGPAARECLRGWYLENATGTGDWRVGDRPVRPADCATETLCLIPSGDRIVPPQSAQGLARALPRARALIPALGHIGMMVGRKARTEVWQPAANFLLQRDS